MKTNITKFTVCDSSDERKKIQLAQVRNKVLPVQDQYRAFVPVYILKKVKCFFAEFFDQKTCLCLCLLVGHATSPPPSDQLSERSQV